jgi:hypothetical protein
MAVRTVTDAATQHLPPRVARHWSVASAAGAAYSRAGRGKVLAHAHGVHESTITRYRQGVTYSPLAGAMNVLASSPRTTAFPALTEAWVLVSMRQVESQQTPALLSRRAELELLEADLARDLFHARMTGEGMRDLRARQADVVIELLAIESVLSERKA